MNGDKRRTGGRREYQKKGDNNQDGRRVPRQNYNNGERKEGQRQPY